MDSKTYILVADIFQRMPINNDEAGDDINKKINSKIDDFPDKFSPNIRIIPTRPFQEVCPRARDIKVALIPLNIPYPNSFEKQEIVIGEDTFEILVISEKNSKIIKKNIIEASKRAARAGANLIIFSELSYPIKERETLDRELFEICKQKKCFIIAGSYHETGKKDRAKNKCLVFSPYDEKPVVQVKLNRGYFGGKEELIKIPDNRIIYLINTRYGKIAVVICVDVQSEDVIKNFVVLNRADKIYSHVDFIIVPSYTDKPNEILKSCEILSDRSKTCVIYVGDASYGDNSAVFIGNNKIEHKNISKTGLPINICKVDLCDIWKERQKVYSTKTWAPIDMSSPS